MGQWAAQLRAEVGTDKAWMYKRCACLAPTCSHPWVSFNGDEERPAWAANPVVECVGLAEPCHGATRTVVAGLRLGGSLPEGSNDAAPEYLGRCSAPREEPCHAGGGPMSRLTRRVTRGVVLRRYEYVTRERRYVKTGDAGKGIWFVDWPEDEQFTGWYVGRAEDVGQVRGFLLVPCRDAAICTGHVPTTCLVSAEGGAGWVPAPGVHLTDDGAVERPAGAGV